MLLPSLEGRPILENQDKRIQAFVFHVDCQGQLALHRRVGNLPNVPDIDASLQPQDTSLGVSTINGARAGTVAKRRRGTRGREQPAEGAFLLLDDTDDRLLEQVDEELAHERIAPHG